VSNLILEDCFKDIADELDETNEAIMNQVCKSEFMVGSISEHSETVQEAKTTVLETEDTKMIMYETGPVATSQTPVHMSSKHHSVSFNVDEQYSADEFEEDSDEYEDIDDDDDDDDDEEDD
jgi:hypothetical protein